MSDKLKKQLILNLPYILIGLYATKLGEAWRLAEGADASQKFLHLMDGFTAAFQSPLPSFHLSDLLIGLVIGCVLRLLVYEKSRNAKKYRRNEEYGSARWQALRHANHCLLMLWISAFYKISFDIGIHRDDFATVQIPCIEYVLPN